MEFYARIADLIKGIETCKDIEIVQSTFESHSRYKEHMDIEDAQSRIVKNLGFKLPAAHLDFMVLSGLKIDWQYSKNKDWLYGGFIFTSLMDVLIRPSNFWKIYNDPAESKEQEAFLTRLNQFQKSGHGQDGTFGCMLRVGDYPYELYYYDSGSYWPMNVSLELYFEQLLKYKAVAGWQLFYIDQQDLYDTLIEIPNNSWPLTYLEQDLKEKSRAHCALRQMEKIIELLPKLFPEVDLKDAKVSHKKFQAKF